jgi:hypothetical protein
MPSIFNPSDNQDLINRIEKLTPTSERQWGKMTVDQMLKHSIAPIDVVFGDLTIKMPFYLSWLGRLFKKSVLNNEFKKGSPTAKEFIFTGSYDFEKSKQELIEKTKKFQDGTKVIKLEKHPFWGKMTPQEWDTLMWKHLDHHLKQFGV